MKAEDHESSSWTPKVLQRLAGRLAAVGFPATTIRLGVLCPLGESSDLLLVEDGRWQVRWDQSGWQPWPPGLNLDILYERMKRLGRPVDRSLHSLVVNLRYPSHLDPTVTLDLKLAPNGKWFVV